MRFAVFLVLTMAPIAAAEEVKIVLWNGEKLFDVDTVNSHTADLQPFGTQYSDADTDPRGYGLVDRALLRSPGDRQGSHQEHIPRGDGFSSTGSRRGMGDWRRIFPLDHNRGVNAPATVGTFPLI